jgi:hypothetical protein
VIKVSFQIEKVQKIVKLPVTRIFFKNLHPFRALGRTNEIDGDGKIYALITKRNLLIK